MNLEHPHIIVNGRRVDFPIPLMWSKPGAGPGVLQHGSEIDNRDDLELFSKEQLIDFAIEYAAAKGAV